MKRWQLWARRTAIVTAVLFASAQFVRPEMNEPPHRPLMTGAEVPAEVQQVFNRACQDCHSSNTSWPWYAKVVPVAWMVKQDVDEGRKFLDLTEWDKYTKGQKMGYLAGMVSATKTERMPPPRYTWLHPDAKLSPDERKLIANWARTESRRIRTVRKGS